MRRAQQIAKIHRLGNPVHTDGEITAHFAPFVIAGLDPAIHQYKESSGV